ATLGNWLRAIPERSGRGDRSDELRVAELGAERQHDLAIAGGQPPAEVRHSVLVTEEADHPLIAGDGALIDLEALVERDPDPGIDGPFDLPVGHDPVAMRRPRSDRPAEAVAKTGAQAVGDHDKPCPDRTTRRRQR